MKNRRSFIKKSSIGIFGASLLSPFSTTSAKSYSRILGSNDRVTLAFQGLGRRFPGLLNSSLKIYAMYCNAYTSCSKGNLFGMNMLPFSDT